MNTEHFYPELARLYPSAPWLTFDRALNTSARTLCTLGLAWQEDLEPVAWEAGVADYMLYPPVNTRIVQITQFADLTVTTPRILNDSDTQWRTRTGRPSRYFLLPEDTVRVYPIPTADEEDAVFPRVALAPTVEHTDLNDTYAWPHERLLLHGAIAHLGGIPWGEFEAECRRIRSQSVDGNHIGVPRTVRYGGY